MDREEFLHSIKCEDMTISDIVVNFFDQYMLLYDLVDTVSNTSIIQTNKNNIVFQLDMNDESSTSILRDKLAAIPSVVIFESFYNIFFDVISPTSIVIQIAK